MFKEIDGVIVNMERLMYVTILKIEDKFRLTFVSDKNIRAIGIISYINEEMALKRIKELVKKKK